MKHYRRDSDGFEVQDCQDRDLAWVEETYGAAFAEIFPITESTVEIWERIKAERDFRKTNGGYEVDGYWFHSDIVSRTQQLGLLFSVISDNLMWKTMSGEFVPMTNDLAAQVLQASVDNDMAIFSAAEAHKAAMEASASPLEYSFSNNWPLSFEEITSTK